MPQLAARIELAVACLSAPFIHFARNQLPCCAYIRTAQCSLSGDIALEDNPSILVVEDETLILLMIESALEDGGFKAILAPSGERAIQVLDTQNPPFRAVVTDVNLGPGKSGWDVAKRAREIDPNIAVIYVTGHGEDDWPSQGLPKSVLITKPFAVAQLLTAVSNLLNGSSQQQG